MGARFTRRQVLQLAGAATASEWVTGCGGGAVVVVPVVRIAIAVSSKYLVLAKPYLTIVVSQSEVAVKWLAKEFVDKLSDKIVDEIKKAFKQIALSASAYKMLSEGAKLLLITSDKKSIPVEYEVA